MERDAKTHAVIGAAMEVHRVLGAGFLEAVYHEALAREFSLRGVSFRSECDIPVIYKGERLSTVYRADFLCFDSLIVEVKAIKQLTPLDEGQVLNYLKAAGLRVALLLNFGTPSLQHKRFVFGPDESVKSA